MSDAPQGSKRPCGVALPKNLWTDQEIYEKQQGLDNDGFRHSYQLGLCFASSTALFLPLVKYRIKQNIL